jgi:hypothetical protein
VVERRVLLTVSSESYSDRHLEALRVLLTNLIQGRWVRVAMKIEVVQLVLAADLSEVVREGLSRERRRSER